MTCVAIVPARRAEATLERTLESLRTGDDGFLQRILVITSIGDPSAAVARAQRSRDARVEVVEAAAPLSAGAARNLGRVHAERAEVVGAAAPLSAGAARNLGRVHAARAQLLLFIDADCRLQRGGARMLASELERRGLDAVSARVLREGGGTVARVRHALEFKEAEGRRSVPPQWLPPSTTMMCRAEAFDRAGGFPDMWPGEDLVLSHALRQRGRGIELSRSVSTWHEHPTGWREMLAHQYRLGRTSAIARREMQERADGRTAAARGGTPAQEDGFGGNSAVARGGTEMEGGSFVRYPVLAPLLVPGRLIRVVSWHCRIGGMEAMGILALSPLLVAGLIAWTSGFLAGARSAGSLVSRVAATGGHA